MKKIAPAFFAIVSLVALTACNTIQGIGKDIEKGGEAIQRSTR